jgi:hypothetical protein
MNCRIPKESHCYDHKNECEQKPSYDLASKRAFRVSDAMNLPSRCPIEAIESRVRIQTFALLDESPDGPHSPEVEEQSDSHEEVEPDHHCFSAFLPCI